MSPSSSPIRAAAVVSVAHEHTDSQEVDRPRYLDARHEPLPIRSLTIPRDRESTGRIVTLSTGRFGVLAPRAPKERQRRPIGVADSMDAAQTRLRNWKQGRVTVVAFVAWLANFLPRKPSAQALPAAISKSGVRAKPGARKVGEK